MTPPIFDVQSTVQPPPGPFLPPLEEVNESYCEPGGTHLAGRSAVWPEEIRRLPSGLAEHLGHA